MQNFFPADVSLRVSGEISAAQRLFPAAKQLLYRALSLQQNGAPIVRLFMPFTDGSLVHVYIHQGLKHVYVQPFVPVPTKKEEEITKVEPLITLVCPDVLNGVIHPGTAVEVGEDDDGNPIYAVDSFHPTQMEADIFGLDFAWIQSERLAVTADSAISGETLQVVFPKPSMYSGAMKRVVQALYGIGRTKNVPKGESTAKTYEARNHYDFRWDHTDGIRRVEDSIWLVRISKYDGVLAMPLPLFPCTTSEAFRTALEDIGDTETLAIVAEFGGLPTGETFPENHPDADPPTFERDEAIADGKLLRLLTAEQMQPFYVDAASGKLKLALWGYCGWAFSESGAATSAHNTCFWYSNEAAATANILVWPTDGFDDLPLEDRMLRAEHWKVEINLSVINPTPTAEEPVGVGSAILSQVEASLMIGEPKYVDPFRFDLPFFKVPGFGTGESVYTLEYWGRTSTAQHELQYSYVYNAVFDISCPVTVFYIGESLEVVRHQPPKTHVFGTVRGPWVETAAGSIGFGTGDPYFTEHGFSDNPLATVKYFATTYFDWFYVQDGAVQVARKLVPEEQPYVYVDGVQTTLPAFYEVSSAAVSMSGDAITRVEYEVSYPITYKRPGRFYSTSLDIRGVSRQYGAVTSGIDESTTVLYADSWEEEVGLVIPPMCREGIVFVHYFGGTQSVGSPRPLLSAGVQQVALIPDLSATPVVLSTLPSNEVNYNTSAGARWRSVWTSIYNYQFKFGASINAGPTKCGVVSNGVYRTPPNQEDYVLTSFLGSTVYIPNLPASYIGSANGIDVTGFAASDVTFVGAV